VTLPLAVPLANSDRPESASSGISFIESGLSSGAGSEFSTLDAVGDAVVIIVAADDGFGLADALPPLSRWLGCKNEQPRF